MKSPSVSVVMSVFNGSRYVGRSVESILGQCCRDFEFIIVDDGSDDDTAEILGRYHDPRIRLMVHDENQGLTRSLIHAIEKGRACRQATKRRILAALGVPWEARSDYFPRVRTVRPVAVAEEARTA